MAAKAVLGISLGTRRLGIAIVRDGRLVHFQMHTFQGTWSQKKLRGILQAINRHLDLHSVEKIAVKMPDVLPGSKAFTQLIGSLNVTSESKRIPVRYYTLKDLKLAHAGSGKIPRSLLIESIVKRHPELLPEYHKEKRNEEAYYYKMFEAVLCADMQRLRN